MTQVLRFLARAREEDKQVHPAVRGFRQPEEVIRYLYQVTEEVVTREALKKLLPRLMDRIREGGLDSEVVVERVPGSGVRLVHELRVDERAGRYGIGPEREVPGQ